MAWKLIESLGKQPWVIGEVRVKTIKTSFSIPKSLTGQGFNWYFDETEGIAKIQLEEKAIRKIGVTACFPKHLREMFKDDQAVCYYDEDALYFGTYKAGQTKLMSFLKRTKVV
jgi:hypothetical protein